MVGSAAIFEDRQSSFGGLGCCKNVTVSDKGRAPQASSLHRTLSFPPLLDEFEIICRGQALHSLLAVSAHLTLGDEMEPSDLTAPRRAKLALSKHKLQERAFMRG